MLGTIAWKDFQFLVATCRQRLSSRLYAPLASAGSSAVATSNFQFVARWVSKNSLDLHITGLNRLLQEHHLQLPLCPGSTLQREFIQVIPLLVLLVLVASHGCRLRNSLGPFLLMDIHAATFFWWAQAMPLVFHNIVGERSSDNVSR